VNRLLTSYAQQRIYVLTLFYEDES